MILTYAVYNHLGGFYVIGQNNQVLSPHYHSASKEYKICSDAYYDILLKNKHLRINLFGCLETYSLIGNGNVTIEYFLCRSILSKNYN